MCKGLISVVLPVYNVEKYLDRCMESVVNQTYSNLEIFLIDDGSTDSSPEICERWAEKDNRIKVIHKENAGAGMARNTAIEFATGEYFYFVDSDDYIELDAIEKAYLLAKKEKAEIVVFGFNRVNSKGEVVEKFVPKVGYKTYEGQAVLEEFFPEYLAPNPRGDGTRNFYMSNWVLLYSGEIIRNNEWKFASERDVFTEDVYSQLDLFRYVNKVAVLPEALYYYCTNKDSLSRAYQKDRYKKVKHFYIETVALCERLGYSDDIVHRVSKPYLGFTISTLKMECTAHSNKKECKKALEKIIEDDVLQKVLKQNKKDKVSVTRKALFFAMRNRLYNLCYYLLCLRT